MKTLDGLNIKRKSGRNLLIENIKRSYHNLAPGNFLIPVDQSKMLRYLSNCPSIGISLRTRSDSVMGLQLEHDYPRLCSVFGSAGLVMISKLIPRFFRGYTTEDF